MMRQYELVERVTSYNPDADEALLNKAYVYAMQKHGSQTRASGDPYFSHPLEVAAILTELRLDTATIAVALLHDTIEDTDATRTEIDNLFGAEIGKLVEGLTKISKLDLVSKRAQQAENLRKLLLAISDDVRVLLVKLADRLHNMRTLHFVPDEKKARISEETMDIYAPLAGRMGMHDMREELEELAFQNLHADAYKTICQRLEDLRNSNTSLISEIEQDLTLKLAAQNISAIVKNREKRPFSIFRKMQLKSVSFEQLSDIYGFRIVVGSQAECYTALGVVHSTWATVPGRFKDYISNPKQNDYRSLHTTVIGPGRQRVELQIRSPEMQDVAEYGIAAHALYKDQSGTVKGGRPLASNVADGRAYGWLRRTIELLVEGDSPEEFLEHTKLELFHDQVFCFTPKGRLIALPRGATPIDFAYAVHTDVGDTCVGCKINRHIAPLVTKLQNGDEVEIVRSKAQTPPSAWEAIAATGKARAAIRRATRAAVRKQYAGLGKQILERVFERAGQQYSLDMLEAALPRLARNNVEDLLAAVGRGEIGSRDVISAVFPDYQDERANVKDGRVTQGWFNLTDAESMQFRIPGSGNLDQTANTLPIRGITGNLPIMFAPDGGAVPGDRIVGILSPGESITIYPIQSDALKNYDDQTDRWLDVRWDINEDSRERFPAKISISVINEPGSLAQVAAVMGENDGNIDNIKMTQRAPDFYEMYVDIGVWNLTHLNRIIHQLRTRDVVSQADRVYD